MNISALKTSTDNSRKALSDLKSEVRKYFEKARKSSEKSCFFLNVPRITLKTFFKYTIRCTCSCCLTVWADKVSYLRTLILKGLKINNCRFLICNAIYFSLDDEWKQFNICEILFKNNVIKNVIEAFATRLFREYLLE